MSVNIAVVGGGSSYTPELFANLADFAERFEVAQVTLMDPNPSKLDFVADVCKRLIAENNLSLTLKATTEIEEALPGVDFVLMQVRVGGLAARIRDETTPMDLGMVGNETTGAGGFSCALRTIPVALEIARHMERLSPNAWLLNLSNPAGIVTEALLKHSQIRSLGFCNIPINTTYALARLFDVDPTRARLDSFGLNHLSWTRGFYFDGEELLQPLLDTVSDRQSPLYQHGLVENLLEPEWLQRLKMIPGWYLRYFYYPEWILEADRRKGIVRGEEDVEAESRLHDIYTHTGYGEEAQRILKTKGGAQYYLPVLQVIDSIVHDRGDEIIVDTANQSAIPDLPPDACVEVPAHIFREKVVPVPGKALPLNVRGLVQTVKAYEELTIEAALTGNQGAASAALMANPLVGTYPKARAYLDRMLEQEGDLVGPLS